MICVKQIIILKYRLKYRNIICNIYIYNKKLTL